MNFWLNWLFFFKNMYQTNIVTHVTHRFFQRSRHSISTLFIIQLRSLFQSKFEYLSSTPIQITILPSLSVMIIFLLDGFDVSVLTFVSKSEVKFSIFDDIMVALKDVKKNCI